MDLVFSSEKLIGSNVYDPLADYYVENRTSFEKINFKKLP